MMAMPLGPLMSVLFSITFMAMLVRSSPTLTLFATALSAIIALIIIFYKGRYFPRWIMDVLDRLTNKASLEAAYGARSRKLVTIDAELLAGRLKSRVIGQNAAIESIAVQLRRRLARNAPTNRSRSSAWRVRPESAKPTLPRSLPTNSTVTGAICISST
jgi:hypothetical protein